jgi:hypothetical protein
MRNYFLVVISLFVMLGCNDDKEKKEESNNNNCDNKAVTRNDSIIITGCSDFETDLTFSGAYLMTIYEKAYGDVSDFEVYQSAFDTYMGVKSYSASALREDNWYSQSSIWENLNGAWKWRVTATGEYKIVFAKLPLQKTPDTAPVNYNGSGLTVVGPVHLSGSTTFNIACPDAKQAGFTANLYDAVTGDEILENYFNILNVVNLDENNNQINNYSKTINKDLPEGDYLITVSSNYTAAWTVEIN